MSGVMIQLHPHHHDAPWWLFADHSETWDMPIETIWMDYQEPWLAYDNERWLTRP